MSRAPAQAPRRRHLMDPDNLQRDQSNTADITRVQTWVMSTLAVTSILHMSGGLLVAAWFIDPAQQTARWGLAVIAGAFGVIAVAAGLGIHRRPVLSPWLILGVVPTLIGLLVLS